MTDSLKVLMMGGRRAGKTSVLAGLLETMLHGEVRNFVSITDVTEATSDNESLDEKISELKQCLVKKRDKVFLVDDSKTSNFVNHDLQIRLPNGNGVLNIEFKDANGEFYESQSEYDIGNGSVVQREEIVRAVEESDVYIIAIDTPYMMEAVNPRNKLCDESVNRAYNHVSDIHSYLTHIDDKDGADAKMVLFVPLKCEKWAKAGEINKVVERTKEVYSVVIKALKSYKNIEIDIIPVQTVGSIEFLEHKTAYVCSNEKFVARKCCVSEDETQVRFENGEERRILPSDMINEDPEARISKFHHIIRPYSWFHVTGTEYSPRNCEQLAYYILQFLLNKYIFVKKMEEAKDDGGLFGIRLLRGIVAFFMFLAGIPDDIRRMVTSKINQIFRMVSFDELSSLVNSLHEKGLIKQNTEGIENINKSLLDRYNR